MTTYSLREATPWAFDKYIHPLADPVRVAAHLANGDDEDTAYAKTLISMAEEDGGWNARFLKAKFEWRSHER